MKIHRVGLAVLFALGGVGAALSGPPTYAFQKDAPAPELKADELYKQASPSIMTLTVHRKDGGIATGSAFLAVQEGLAVTAWHVVNNAEKVTAKFASGEEFDVSGLVDKDVKRDLALIRVKVFGKPFLPAEPADPAVGAKAFVIGAPKGLEFSITDGIVSQVRQENGIKFFQFTCPTSPGNSGGPLINAQGKVIGVVSFQRRDGQNLNFAFPMAYALGLDRTLPTQPWENVKPEKTELPDLEQKRPAPLPPIEFKGPAAKRNTLKVKVPKNPPFTFAIASYHKRDLKTLQVANGKQTLERVEGEPAEKTQYRISDLGIFTVHSSLKGKELQIAADYSPHRVAILISQDPSSGDLQDSLVKRLEAWGDEVQAGAEVKAIVEKIAMEEGGYRGVAKQLNCDRLIVASTTTRSRYVPDGLASYYLMASHVEITVYDLLTGEKVKVLEHTVSGRSGVLEGQRGARQDLVRACTFAIVDALAGSSD